MIETQTRRRILVIDDNEAIHADFLKTLAAADPADDALQAASAALFGDADAGSSPAVSFDVESAFQGQEGLAKVQQSLADHNPYALAFVDMRMPPGWDGVETIKRLWEIDPALQVVICTAYSDYSWEGITAALGTSDRFLILRKPFDPMEVSQLAAALTEKWKLKQAADIKVAELERMVHERTAELSRMALADKLTGLPNRARLHELLDKAAHRAKTDPAYQYAVHFLDFDRFKVINDSLGHEMGDALLVNIAKRLQGIVAQTPGEHGACSAARLGGDEFVILQEGIASVQAATALANDLVHSLENVYRLGEVDVTSTASIGIAVSATGYLDGKELLRDADAAMYAAKAAGRGTWAMFNKEMHNHAVARLTLESQLRAALKESQFSLAYQPIISLADGKVESFEALARWTHPERGSIPPLEFIPIAEETGLICRLGQWVLDEALRQLSQWTRDNPAAAHLSIAVNVSPKQFTQANFVDCVKAALAQHGIAPSRLTLEVTESTVMDDQKRAAAILRELMALGVHVHMDDFGTGYSSLNCLHGLPLTALKIDRSFIANLSGRRDYAAVINAIILLAHNLNMQVIAEGVETPEHTALLSALECDLVQGYHFSEPLTPQAAAAFILSHGRLP